MNKFIATGNLTKDGEIRTTQSNKEVYSGTIAIRRNYKNQEGNYYSDFFNIIYWQPNEYIKANLKKGAKCMVEGRLQTRTYEENRNKRYLTEIIVEDMEIYTRTQNENTQKETKEVPQNTTSNYEDGYIVLQENDLPF